MFKKAIEDLIQRKICREREYMLAPKFDRMEEKLAELIKKINKIECEHKNTYFEKRLTLDMHHHHVVRHMEICKNCDKVINVFLDELSCKKAREEKIHRRISEPIPLPKK